MAGNGEKFLKFIWKVENFSYCWNEKDDFLKSPTFYLDIFEGSAWCLKLYPRGKTSYEKFLGVNLERLSSSKGPLGITIDFKVTLLRANGATEYVREMEDRCFRKGREFGFDNLIAREVILGAKKSTLLPEDTLTLQCCIFPKNTELKNYTEVIAKTHIEVECYRYQLKAIDYTTLQPVSFSCEGEQKLIGFYLIMSKKSYHHPDILSIKFSDATNLKALHYKIGVLDSNDLVVKLLVNHIFDIESSECGHLYFPLIAVPELMKKKSLYLPNGKLNLDCEFTLCYGLQHSQIEGISRNATFTSVTIDKAASTFQIDAPRKKFLHCIENIPSSIKNDYQNLYQEGTLSDFTIRVGDESLRVHKAVLCARSPVFKAMLTSNMKENAENVADISDLGEDTVRRMLTFMYTDMAGDLDWETAKKLYFAADKYGLIALKRICAEALKQDLSVTSVGEALVLANMHADDDLKKITVDFIFDHETEVMCSTEWKTFMADELQLAAETMHHIFLKKSENRH